MWKPSRTKFYVLTAATVVGGPIAYDRYECQRIRSQLLEEASAIARQPLGHTMQKPRHLKLYLSVDTTSNGNSYVTAFDRYVKPVWDAAALDYEMVECWLWWDHVRPLVGKYLRGEWIKNATMATTSEEGSDSNKMTADQYWKQIQEPGAGGNGVVALGRSAYKGVLTGLVDFVGEQMAAKREQEGSRDLAMDEMATTTAKDQETSQKERSGWFWWLRRSASTTTTTATTTIASPVAKQQAQQDPSKLEASLNDHFGSVSAEAKEWILPPIGFIPFQPQSWYRRLYYDRKNVERVGRSALAIAQGQMVPLQDLFPGTIAFSVEDGERESESKGKKACLDGEEVASAAVATTSTTTTTSSSADEQQDEATSSDASIETGILPEEPPTTSVNEEEQPLPSSDPHVVHVTENGEYILSESLLQHVQMYYKP